MLHITAKLRPYPAGISQMIMRKGLKVHPEQKNGFGGWNNSRTFCSECRDILKMYLQWYNVL